MYPFSYIVLNRCAGSYHHQYTFGNVAVLLLLLNFLLFLFFYRLNRKTRKYCFLFFYRAHSMLLIISAAGLGVWKSPISCWIDWKIQVHQPPSQALVGNSVKLPPLCLRVHCVLCAVPCRLLGNDILIWDIGPQYEPNICCSEASTQRRRRSSAAELGTSSVLRLHAPPVREIKRSNSPQRERRGAMAARGQGSGRSV